MASLACVLAAKQTLPRCFAVRRGAAWSSIGSDNFTSIFEQLRDDDQAGEQLAGELPIAAAAGSSGCMKYAQPTVTVKSPPNVIACV